MTDYDPKIIQKYAAGLYTQAKSVVTCYFFIGIFGSVVLFSRISNILMGEFDFLIVAIGVFTGGVIGIFAGKNRAFEMQLKAQQALCQVQIQQNTVSKKSDK